MKNQGEGIVVAEFDLTQPMVMNINDTPSQSGLSLQVAKVDRVKIYVYGGDGEHKRPHYHVRVNSEHSASYDIKDNSIIEGSLPKVLERRVLEEASKKKQDIIKGWNKLNPAYPVLDQ